MSVLDQPAVQTALLGAFVALLLLVQTWAQERRRKIETEKAREQQAEANAAKVVEKLSGGRTSPMPYPTDPAIRIVDAAVTPSETPDAKRNNP